MVQLLDCPDPRMTEHVQKFEMEMEQEPSKLLHTCLEENWDK